MRSPGVALGLCVLLAGAFCLGSCGEDRSSTTIQAYDAQGRALQPTPVRKGLPNLVVVILDSMRADALREDGARMAVGPDVPMPFFASLARRGVSFSDATAAAPWTLPSVMSLLTGMLPSHHGQSVSYGGWHLPDAVTTYAEVLREAYGYETAAFMFGPWFENGGRSLLQGFDHWVPTFCLQAVDGTVGAWNARRDPDRPFFLLLHTFESHHPYGKANHPWPPGLWHGGPPRADPALLEPGAEPAEIVRACWTDQEAGLALLDRLGPELPDIVQRYIHRGYAESPRPELAAELERAYWDGLRWVDGLLATTHASLQGLGLLENTLFVVTSDHGEAFGEHGNLGHALQLYHEVIQVPLVMVGGAPFDRGEVIPGQIGLLDLMPTFLDWAGMTPMGGVQGRSFLDIIDGETWCRPVISEERLTRDNTGGPTDAVKISARTPSWKYIITYDLRTGDVREQIFDLLIDPQELDDLAGGTGRLPEDFPIDPCLCPAVEEARTRVWGAPDSTADEVAPALVPYGARAPRAVGPRPVSCGGS